MYDFGTVLYCSYKFTEDECRNNVVLWIML